MIKFTQLSSVSCLPAAVVTKVSYIIDTPQKKKNNNPKNKTKNPHCYVHPPHRGGSGREETAAYDNQN